MGKCGAFYCFNYVEQKPGVGRPRLYCSDACRRWAANHAARERAKREAHTVTRSAPCTCDRDYLTVPLEESGWCVGCYH